MSWSPALSSGACGTKYTIGGEQTNADQGLMTDNPEVNRREQRLRSPSLRLEEHAGHIIVLGCVADEQVDLGHHLLE